MAMDQTAKAMSTLSSGVRCGVIIAICLVCISDGNSAERSENKRSDRRQLHVVRGVEFVVDEEISKARLEELASNFEDVQHQVVEELNVPPVDVPVRFYLFAHQKDFTKYVTEHVPSVRWSETLGRHGIYLLRQDRPYVFLVKSDDLIRCLRHESVHVVLNGSHRGLPIWLDEGLAQCYESDDEGHWCDRAARILSKDVFFRSSPTVESLMKLRSMSQMGTREYAGAWANVRYLLEDEQVGRTALCVYLSEIRRGNENPLLPVRVPLLGRTDFIKQ